MPLGGRYVTLPAPAGCDVADIILRTCKRYWGGHEVLFQPVHSLQVQSLREPTVWLYGTREREFFVYRDREAYLSWGDGPTPLNSNLMLHFIIGEPSLANPTTCEVSMCFDRLSRDVRRLLRELQAGFIDLRMLSGG